MIGGLVTLLGWITGLRGLTDWKSDGIAMFPNTAVCAMASGLSLWLIVSRPQRHRAAASLAMLVVLVAGATLIEHLTGIDFGIDTVVANVPWGQSAATAPMRMGPPATTSFLLLAIGLLLVSLGSARRGLAACLGVAAATIALLPLIGHLYGAEQMYTIPRLTGIAMQAAGILVALALGLVASIPDREPMRTLLERGAAGVLVRRALPVVVLLAIAVGGLRVILQDQELVDTAFGAAARTLVEIVTFIALLWWAAATVRTHDQARRANEATTRRQAGQLATFVDTAAIGLHRVGPDGTILWVNDAELETLGYAREEYVGHHIAEFHVDQAVIADILARLHAGEKLIECPARMRCKDGSIKAVLIDSSVLWEDGRFIHTQCFTRDVTDRVGAEQSRALLAAIVEASDDAIVSKTLEGRITSWNAGAERIFGYTAAEAVGRSIELIIPTERLDEEREILRRIRRGERVEHFETVRRAKDGHLLDVDLSISPVRDEVGTIIGASKIARDISERKRAELERAENDRRKDEFLAILAHELRNPLAPVRNAARYLRLKGPTDPELRRPVDMIERQVAQMARLIDDLLDVSRISRGTLELRRERVAASEIVDAAVDACQDDIQAKGHRLRIELPTAPIELDADRERLIQVLSNLIGNAVKYTPAGGRITLRVEAEPPSTFIVTVKDDGIGIPPGKLTEIFDLFARVDQSLERQGGLGIGLTLARQLVELHGGTIEARSEGVGCGSELVVKLPVIVASAPAAAAASAPEAPVSPLRILVADDNEDSADSLKILLESAGHEVHAVFDGEAAISAIAELRPEVALLDIGMPRANGYEVARRVRAEPWGRDVHLVALTGWGQQADKQRAHDAGFDAHLVKPVPLEALDALLATVADRRAADDAGARRVS
ncbi:MAG TPA: PAS domain S-box protein [Candidatus Binatia bacterium]|jgi:PAS domain S-box-containing protein